MSKPNLTKLVTVCFMAAALVWALPACSKDDRIHAAIQNKFDLDLPISDAEYIFKSGKTVYFKTTLPQAEWETLDVTSSGYAEWREFGDQQIFVAGDLSGKRQQIKLNSALIKNGYYTHKTADKRWVLVYDLSTETLHGMHTNYTEGNI